MVEWFDVQTNAPPKEDDIWACATGRPMRLLHWDETLGWVDEDDKPLKSMKWWRPT